MASPPSTDIHPDLLAALVADRTGQLRAPAAGTALDEDAAAAAAVAIAQLASAGDALGMGALQLVQVRSDRQALLAAVRDDSFLLALADPQRTGPAQALLAAWDPAAGLPTAPPRPAPAPAAPPPASAPDGARAPVSDAWTRLRRALVRGDVATTAAAWARDLETASGSGTDAVPPADRERALNLLLDGIACIAAGDGQGGLAALREVAAAEPNESLRWLAIVWSARAAVRTGAFAAAGASAKQALALSKGLDEEARAVTQGIVGELLPFGKDPPSALPWLAEARTRFERLGDPWGIGQARLAQARVLSTLGREAEADEAARLAAQADAGCDEAAAFLARSAVARGDLAGAETLLEPFQTRAADRVRAAVAAVKEGTLAQGDAVEFLREADAPARVRSIRALERVTKAAPRFAPARLALAWMLANLGKAAEASALFQRLVGRELAPGDRASTLLGLERCAGLAAAAQAPAPARPVGPPAAEGATAAPALPEPAAAPSHTPPPVGASGGGSVFSGEFSALGLPDLLQFLRGARRTGVLACNSSRGTCTLHFAEGHVTRVTSPAAPPIGQLLVEAHSITAEALGAAVSALGPEASDQLVCEHLLREGLVDGAALEDALTAQVGRTMRELLEWKDGAFVFDRSAGAAPLADGQVAVDVQGPLLRLFQELDEAARDAAGSQEAL
jgi:tetratricopeptide (TPR) repeat protein